MEKYDGIRWVLAHAGGFVPYIAQRILLTSLRSEPKWKLAAMAVDRDRAVAKRMEIFRRFWFDVALSSTPTTFLRSSASPTRVTCSTAPTSPSRRRLR